MADKARGRTSGRSKTGSVSETLRSLVDPLGLVVLTRDRIEDALNDAVSRGRVTTDDAQELAAALVERGRRQTNDVLGELESLLAAKAGKARRAAGLEPRPRAKSSGLPIAGYDDLNAKDVQGKLDGLTPAQLRKVRDHERANANRKTVLAAIERRLK